MEAQVLSNQNGLFAKAAFWLVGRLVWSTRSLTLQHYQKITIDGVPCVFFQHYYRPYRLIHSNDLWIIVRVGGTERDLRRPSYRAYARNHYYKLCTYTQFYQVYWRDGTGPSSQEEQGSTSTSRMQSFPPHFLRDCIYIVVGIPKLNLCGKKIIILAFSWFTRS